MSTKHAQFEALVNAYSADLYRYAYWLVKEKQFAEDLVQETFLRAWRAIHTLQDTKAAKGWLITILRRELARKYEKTRPVTVDIDEVDEPIPEVQFSDDLDNKRVLHKALEKLPKMYREPLILQVLAGYSCDEIAKALETESGTIMTRVFRARQHLKKLLEERTGLSRASRTKP